MRTRKPIYFIVIVGAICLLAAGGLALSTLPSAAQTETPAATDEAAITDTLPSEAVQPVIAVERQAETPSAELTPTATPAVAPAPPAGQPIISSQLILIILLTFGFGLIALAMVLDYVYRVQKRYYNLTESLAQAGQSVQVRVVSALERAQPAAVLEAFTEGEEEPAAPPPKLTVEGPGIVVVGKASEPYTAALDPDNPDIEVTWAAESADIAAVQPSTGRSVQVVAAKAGAFKLTVTATRADGVRTVTDFSVAAIAAEPKAGVELPFVGQGYGSIAIAIVVLTVVVVLGLAGVLDGQAVATVLGGLVGYVFGMGVSSRNGGEKDAG